MDSFIKNGFKFIEFNSVVDANKYLFDNINNKTVGFGGSMTLKEMGLYELLSKNNKVLWHWVNPDDLKNINNLDVYFLSANALSKDGYIVNIDGVANRVTSSLYGHKKVIIIVGKNKVCDTLDEAIYRAKNVAAPLNARRLNKNTPCVKELKCFNCNSKDRICKVVTITSRPTIKDVEIILINEDLGY